MTIETIKMSSKGQLVIPQDIRKEMEVNEGTIFAVVGSRDTIVLRKISTPSKEELIRDLNKIASLGRKKADKLGIKEIDVPDLVHKLRKLKE